MVQFEACKRHGRSTTIRYVVRTRQGQVANDSISGKTISVLHMSDTHIDPRYAIGSEANCSQSLCCRPYSTNTQLHTVGGNASVPASRFGALYCDAPPDLAISAFSAMPQLINKSDVSFTIFTGDIVSHDRDDQLSQAYVEYEENTTYALFKAEMGNSVIGRIIAEMNCADISSACLLHTWESRQLPTSI